MKAWYEPLLDRGWVPDCWIRSGIRAKLAAKLKEESAGGDQAIAKRKQAVIDFLRQAPVTEETEAANEQHYEVPAEFYRNVLGRYLKYSCGYWKSGHDDLDRAEADMLALYCERARVKDGHRILDMGCGWGSLTLYLAEHFPMSKITAISNSHSQRDYIEGQCRQRGFENVQVITADIGRYQFQDQFDRILSVEMLEHVRNYDRLLDRVSSWLTQEGLMFVHIFAHQRFAYTYSTEEASDWIGRHFFSGGTMPSADLLPSFSDYFSLKNSWQVNGKHYQKTCAAWLKRMDESKAEIMPVFQKTYGSEAQAFFYRWRVFFMACEELFGFGDGKEWLVCHYLFEPARRGSAQSA